MESFRPQKSPGSDRFLGLLSSSPPSAAGDLPSSSPFELDEDDIFSTDTYPIKNPNPNPRSHRSTPLSPFHRELNFGILAALPEESNPKFLRRKPFISSSPPPSTSPSTSSVRMIPLIPKPKPDPFGGKIHHNSAPVNVPVAPRAPPGDSRLHQKNPEEEAEELEEDEMLLPPHEIVDRAQRRNEPMTTFSVIEGVGRTLKGRDLRRVRNAVWRKTGFLD